MDGVLLVVIGAFGEWKESAEMIWCLHYNIVDLLAMFE